MSYIRIYVQNIPYATVFGLSENNWQWWHSGSDNRINGKTDIVYTGIIRIRYFKGIHLIYLFCLLVLYQSGLPAEEQCAHIFLTCILLFLVLQVAYVGGQEDGGSEGCVPGFQVNRYRVTYSGPFQKDQQLAQGGWKWKVHSYSRPHRIT